MSITSATVDVIGYNPNTDLVTLAIVEEDPWDGSQERILQLQEKIIGYVLFIIDGQFDKKYPDYSGKRKEICIASTYTIDVRTLGFIEEMKIRMSNYCIDLTHKNLKS